FGSTPPSRVTHNAGIRRVRQDRIDLAEHLEHVEAVGVVEGTIADHRLTPVLPLPLLAQLAYRHVVGLAGVLGFPAHHTPSGGAARPSDKPSGAESRTREGGAVRG